MSVYRGSEEEEMCMEFSAVPAVEGPVEGGEGPQQGSLANSVQKFRFSPTCSRAKRPAHMDTHGPELVHIGKQHISRGTMSQAAATCKVRHVSRAFIHFCHACRQCSISMSERGNSGSPRSPGSHGSHRYARRPRRAFVAGAASSETRHVGNSLHVIFRFAFF